MKAKKSIKLTVPKTSRMYKAVRKLSFNIDQHTIFPSPNTRSNMQAADSSTAKDQANLLLLLEIHKAMQCVCL